MNIVIGIFTVVLLFVSIFLILLVLMQKSKTDGSMAAALGGGATEAAFGADTGNVLSRLTIKFAIAFFVLSFLLYLGNIYVADQQKKSGGESGALPSIEAPATPAPAASDAQTPAAPAATPEAPASIPAAE